MDQALEQDLHQRARAARVSSLFGRVLDRTTQVFAAAGVLALCGDATAIAPPARR